MKFAAQFEFHKIPEWYDDYLAYKRLKQLLSKFSARVESHKAQKLNGVYYLSSTDMKALRIDRVLISRLHGREKMIMDIEADIVDHKNGQRIDLHDNESEKISLH